MDMATLKTTLIITMIMPHTALNRMVLPSVADTIFTLQTIQIVIGILTLVVVLTPVPTAIVIFGQGTIISVQMNWKFTMKCLLLEQFK